MNLPGLRGVSKKGDDELPLAFMLTTVMASCGISPYNSFKRLRFIDFFPFVKKESEEIVRQVEVLNKDPLTAMLERADATESEAYGDFLRGYVSTVKSGGSVTSYLKSKLRSIFEVRAAEAVRSIERLETLVESYMVMLLVLLCVYILVAVMSSSAFTQVLGTFLGGPIMVYLILFLFMPLVSVIFMYVATRIRKGTLMNINNIYYRALPATVISVIFIASLALVPGVQNMVTGLKPVLQNSLGSVMPMMPVRTVGNNVIPIIITVCLALISVPSMISYRKIVGLNRIAEESIPSFLRDVSESRKTGMSPEKSIVHAAGRKGYGPFSEVLQQMVNQVEWGVSLRKIFEDLKDRIRSWPVLTNLLILIETIEVGGGSPEALELLAGYSEKIRDTEKNKRDMLRPYVIMPFIWAILMALTFTFTFYVINQISTLYLAESPFALIWEEMALLSCAIVFQSWVSGFFIGKVTDGTLAAGFKYSMFLAIVSLISLILSQNAIDVFFGALF